VQALFYVPKAEVAELPKQTPIRKKTRKRPDALGVVMSGIALVQLWILLQILLQRAFN
jgi:hypothetical protein